MRREFHERTMKHLELHREFQNLVASIQQKEIKLEYDVIMNTE